MRLRRWLPFNGSDAYANGRAYDELHVDGGVTAQIFLAPPRTRFARFEQMAYGRARERTHYVIRNGKLTPDYKPTEERAVPLATRSITTVTKYQGLSDLRRLDRIARETNARVLFTSIPLDFAKAARFEFNRDYMSEFFLVGPETGRTERAWRSDLYQEKAHVRCKRNPRAHGSNRSRRCSYRHRGPPRGKPRQAD